MIVYGVTSNYKMEERGVLTRVLRLNARQE